MKKLQLTCLLAILATISSAQIYRMIDVETPGTLSTLITELDDEVTNLLVTGNIDARDFSTMYYQFPLLEELDLSLVHIHMFYGYGGPNPLYGGAPTLYPENELPAKAFTNPNANQGKSLKSVILPNSITSIGFAAFDHCRDLIEIHFPDGLKVIEKSAFNMCVSLTSFRIPASLEDIPIFSGTKFENYIVDEDHPQYVSVDGIIYSKDFTTLIKYPSGKKDSVFLVPNFTQSIGNNCFFQSHNLTSIILPPSITHIGAGAFSSCTGLTSLTLPASLISMGFYYPFPDNSRLKTISFLNPVPPVFTDEINHAIDSKPIALYVPASGLMAYKADEFWGQFNIAVKKHVTVYNETAGELARTLINEGYGSLTSITHLTVMGNLNDNDIQQMNTNMTILSEVDLSEANLINNAMPDGAFANKSTLTKIIFPKTLESIGKYAFAYCSNLMGDLQLPEGLKIIGAGSFDGCISLFGSLNIPNSVHTIGNSAFRDCTGFSEHLNFGSGLISIDRYAFYNCSNFSGSLIIPDNVSFIGEEAFAECSGFDSILRLSENMNVISSSIFRNCSNFQGSLIIPSSVTEIAADAFSNCSSISELYLNSNISKIGDNAFNNCVNLEKITLQTSLPPTIFSNTFKGVNKDICSLIIPPSSLIEYMIANYWNVFLNTIERTLTVKTYDASSIDTSSATLNGNLQIIDNHPILAYGFCWNTIGLPDVSDNIINNGPTMEEGRFSNIFSDLSESTTYYVRAFVTDEAKTIYGKEITFTTPSKPSSAGNILGPFLICQGENSVVYSVPPVDGAASYLWTLPEEASGISYSNSIAVNFSNTAQSGELTVKGTNKWGIGEPSVCNLTVLSLPTGAESILGEISVCQSQDSILYTVPLIHDADSYAWTLPEGATGESTTNSIFVSYGTKAVSGNITVKGVNECGAGQAAILPITVNQLPTITVKDTTVICGGSVPLIVEVDYIGDALSYRWSPETGLSDPNISNPIATVMNDIVYTITITTPNSCSISKDLKVTIIPMEKPEIGIVGVGSDNKNLIVWNKPISLGIESYNIYKETNVSDIYELIGSVPYDSLSIFVDDLSRPDVQSNKYRLSIVDYSGLESPLSDHHKTMHLSINKGMGNSWNLIWSPYIGFNVSTYNIYRGLSPDNLLLLNSIAGSNVQYNDLDAPLGNVYYQLEVISPNVVSPSKIFSSQKVIKSTTNITDIQLSYHSSRSNIVDNGIISDIDKLSENQNIKISPNPVKDILIIDCEGGSTFEILTLMGQVIYHGSLSECMTVPTYTFTPGIFVIKVKTGQNYIYKKFIKE